MGKETGISWADATVNFWHGCTKVSQGCKYCYMYRDKKRFGNDGRVITRSAKQTFYSALKWDEPQKIFTCSMSDFFIKESDEVKDAEGNVIRHWRKDAWEVIKNTPQHTWMILTKRPDRIKKCLPDDWGPNGYPNVWIGTSVENQKTANYRIQKLFEIRCAVRWLSVEPLLEKVDISQFLKVNIADAGKKPDYRFPIHWVVVGGESGHEPGNEYTYRPCRLEWIHGIVKQCKEQEVPVHVKQLGTSISKSLALKARHGDDLDDPYYPMYLKNREWPKITEF